MVNEYIYYSITKLEGNNIPKKLYFIRYFNLKSIANNKCVQFYDSKMLRDNNIIYEIHNISILL